MLYNVKQNLEKYDFFANIEMASEYIVAIFRLSDWPFCSRQARSVIPFVEKSLFKYRSESRVKGQSTGADTIKFHIPPRHQTE